MNVLTGILKRNKIQHCGQYEMFCLLLKTFSDIKSQRLIKDSKGRLMRWLNNLKKYQNSNTHLFCIERGQSVYRFLADHSLCKG